VAPPSKAGGVTVWEKVLACEVHPVKAQVLAAMEWIDRPLSATDLMRVLARKGDHVGRLNYHLKALCQWGVIDVHSARRVRGAVETFYVIAPED
jgi:hypothetical protein